jgi:hypothetical protein
MGKIKNQIKKNIENIAYVFTLNNDDLDKTIIQKNIDHDFRLNNNNLHKTKIQKNIAYIFTLNNDDLDN